MSALTAGGHGAVGKGAEEAFVTSWWSLVTTRAPKGAVGEK
jgi:hypothetical protein